jgi:hypothetical protein
MARVHVLREAKLGSPGQWQLCFQWCRYVYDDEGDPTQYGYRFVWRRDDEKGSIQAARGQARIPSLAKAEELMSEARAAGWGDRDHELMEEAADRLRQLGCVVDLATGYVGWPNREAAQKGRLTPELLADERLVSEWAR